MRTACEELTLRTALSDPLIRTMMAADNVDPVELEAMLRRIADEVVPLQPSQMEAAGSSRRKGSQSFAGRDGL